MSEILSNITVDSINQNITVNDNNINVTPEGILLSIFTGAGPVAGGGNNNIQYNDVGALAGSNSFSFNNSTNTVTMANLVTTATANLGNVANVKISGGTNQYFLQTDGTGNLTWAVYPGNISGNSAPGGANTQIQFNDGGANFGGATGFTFDKSSNVVNMPGNLVVAGVITGNVANANYAAYAGNVVNASQPNITSLGTLSSLNVTGTVVANVFSGNANLLTNIPAANIVGTVANANYAAYAGTVLTNAQPNITSLGTLTSLTVTGNIVANVFSGNANLLSNIPAANLIGNISNLRTSDIEIHLGNNAGLTSQGVAAIAIGNSAGQNNQSDRAIAIGDNAGYLNQGLYTVAIGLNAGQTGQGSIAIAIGDGAGSNSQGQFSIALGQGAGGFNQGANSIAIGANAGPVNQGQNTIAINASGANLDANAFANAFYVKPVRNANTSNALYYNSTTGEITYDTTSSGVTQLSNGTSNLKVTGTNANITASINGTSNVLVISNTGITATNFIGNGYTLTNINGANITGNITATVSNANYANFAGNVVNSNQSNITQLGTLLTLSLASGNVEIGGSSNANGISQGIAIGYLANASGSALKAIAIGYDSNARAANTVAIGYQAEARGRDSVAIGRGTGLGTTGISTVAIGEFAGQNAGNSAIAIGARAGRPSQASNSIVLNATGSNLTTSTANTFIVKPIRNLANTNVLMYDTSSGEISYDTLGAYTGYVKTIVTTVGALTAANTVGAGTRAFVTDANTTTFNAVVGGSGANSVPVFSDGTDWKVG